MTLRVAPKLALYAAVLAASLGVGAAVGAAVGPEPDDGDDVEQHEPTEPAHDGGAVHQ